MKSEVEEEQEPEWGVMNCELKAVTKTIQASKLDLKKQKQKQTETKSSNF